jgi:hypothetical protein
MKTSRRYKVVPAIAISLLLAATLTACSSGQSAETPSQSTSATGCSAGSTSSGGYDGQPTTAKSKPIDLNLSISAEVAQGQGETVFVGGNSADYLGSVGKESPARVVRLSGLDGHVEKTIALDSSNLVLSSAPTPTDDTKPIFDSIDQITVGNGRVYVLWDRTVDSSVESSALVALDACSLRVVAVKTLPNLPQLFGGPAIAYDSTTSTVWVPAYPSLEQATALNATTLAVDKTVAVTPDDDNWCVAALNGTIWYSAGEPVNAGQEKWTQTIDAASGVAADPIPALKSPVSCAQTDGKSIYIEFEDQLVAVSSDGTPGQSYDLRIGTVAGISAKRSWAVGFVENHAEVISLDGVIHLKVPLDLQSFGHTTTASNVWVIDLHGELYVLA